MSTETRPILLVCGCQKYRPYLEAALRRFAHPDWISVGVIGDPTIGAPRREGDILILPIGDNYEALPAKVHAAVTWISQTYPDTVGIWKTDDDIVYQDVTQVIRAIKMFGDRPYWGLYTATCQEGPINLLRINLRFEDTALRPRHQAAAYCYGHGYWIGRAALPAICAAGDEYRTSSLEDVCTGHIMNKQGWLPARANIPYRELPRGPELLAHQ
jgi:hypothetical protein